MGSEESRWTDSPLSESHVAKAVENLNQDAEFRATTSGIKDNVVFALQFGDLSAAVCFHVSQRGIEGSAQNETIGMKPDVTLKAQTEHWQEFFSALPKRPFQSYWGMLRVLGKDAGVEVIGDVESFTKHARLWRIVLDRLRDAANGTSTAQPGSEAYAAADEIDDESIIGHYTWLIIPPLGKCKIFYEVSGKGDQPILFLHTAGADSRQYHSVMMSKPLQARYKMYAFDLPGHGRSFPGATQYPLGYANSETFYIDCIRQFSAKLGLKRTIVTGASMGGQVCLAVALCAEELDVRGVIPCEACAFIPSQSGSTIYDLQGDEGILNAERVCGMISPSSPPIYRRLNWWLYSAQASRIFPGDLKFYFDGWDGRDRMRLIDSQACPVYMLTGEYDYSCSVEMSRETAEMIRRGEKGGNVVFEEMKGLGHFPFSEDPLRFLPYFTRALTYILDRSAR
jgi:pimeloyl-ACP methyl ester carboxylesterase